VGDLQKPKFLAKKLRFVLKIKNQVLTELYHVDPFDEASVLAEYTAYGERLDRFIVDAFPVVQEALARGDHILLEGAQGSMLDLDFGTYPYVTSSAPTAGGALTGSGIPPTKVDVTMGVFKAYTTRVGYGPFPSELLDGQGEFIREIGKEYGTTTGRARRVGWFDGVVARYAVALNGIGSIALTKLDVLDEVPRIKICTGYLSKGQLVNHPMSNISHLKHCEPVYEELPGWLSPTSEARRWEDLPPKAQAYVRRLEEIAGARVDYISVGPGRDQTIKL
jgi:adenylosuccinate synthase